MGIIDGYSKLIENPTDKLKKCVDEYHTWFILLADNIDIDSIANRTEAEKLKEFLQIIRRYDKSTSKFLPTNITALLKEVVQKGLGRIEESMQKLPIGTASNENDFKLEGSSGQKNKQQGSAFDTKDSSEPSTNIYFVGISATIGLFLGLSIAYLAGAATLTPVGAAVAVFLAAAAVGASVGYGVGKVSQKLLVEPINKHSKQESRV
ncbi:MAG: hypothetical protein PG978_000048 [Wolbachia endosymbiont of Ctenocephalides felis wCfeF]|nr:MAG: hypothetical protein PG978_000048 [Wolbachia endosymbiont of Ctenocephalides felis wCfeF]